MGSSVVCISAADGAGGAEVARLVAEGLGYQLIDEALIERAARSAGVDADVVADAERRRGLLERLVESAGASADVAALAMAGIAPSYAADSTPQGEALRDLIRSAIEETAAQGNLVVYAHGGSVALAQREEVLRVLVTASVEVRTRRLGEERSLEASAAAKAVAASDRGRADYLKRFYRVDAELPTLYDLVVNTDRLTFGEAAALVVAAAGRVASAEPAAL